MENLNAEIIINEIQSLIKALKDCGGWVKRGNGEGWFNHEILADALSLINSQEQRIKELTEENERLKAQKYMAYSDGTVEMIPTVEQVRADTIKKMQKRMKEQRFSDITPHDYDLLHCFIDGVAKEMLEGENER